MNAILFKNSLKAVLLIGTCAFPSNDAFAQSQPGRLVQEFNDAAQRAARDRQSASQAAMRRQAERAAAKQAREAAERAKAEAQRVAQQASISTSKTGANLGSYKPLTLPNNTPVNVRNEALAAQSAAQRKLAAQKTLREQQATTKKVQEAKRQDQVRFEQKQDIQKQQSRKKLEQDKAFQEKQADQKRLFVERKRQQDKFNQTKANEKRLAENEAREQKRLAAANRNQRTTQNQSTNTPVSKVKQDQKRVENTIYQQPSETNFVVSSNGFTSPIPSGATRSVTRTGEGSRYINGAGGHGFDRRTTSVNIMTGTENHKPRSYYMNNQDQKVDPFTGKTVDKKDPWAHIYHSDK